MNPTQKAFFANTFGWAEFEVEDNVRKFGEGLKHFISGEGAAAGPTQEAFEALKARVEDLEEENRQLLAFRDDLVGKPSAAPQGQDAEAEAGAPKTPAPGNTDTGTAGTFIGTAAQS